MSRQQDPAREALAKRLRQHLPPTGVQERSMFGGRCFMVDDKLAACAFKGGSLLVRVPAERHEALLGRAGAAQAEMGPGRTMGPGWIEVDASALTDDELAFWIAVALEHNRTLPR